VRTNDNTTAQLGKVAQLHYEHNLTHHEIAALLGLSRVKVTRLLAEARRTGIVSITINTDERLFLDLENRLVGQFGLSRAWVGPSLSDHRASASLGAVGAQCMTALLTPETRVVTVGFSQSVAYALQHMSHQDLHGVSFVQATGNPSSLDRVGSSSKLTIGFADTLGGHSYQLPAPLLATTAAVAEVLSRETVVRDVLERASKADLLIAGVGAMGNDSRMLIDAVGDDDLERLSEAGAVGDLCARFFDAEGNAINSDIDQRVIGLALDQLAAIPTRVAIAVGAGKVHALRGAMQGGLINTLVTDTETARLLLDSSAALPVRAEATG